MVTLSYILKDLSRRRFQTLSAIGALALAMGGLTFLVLYGLGLGFNYSKLPWRVSVGLNYIFAVFILIASILVFLIGLIALSSFSSLLTGLRVRDIGIMKAIGLAEEVNSFFLFESLIIAFLGCVIGIVGGLLSFYLTTVFFRILGFSVISVQPFSVASVLFILGMLISFISILFSEGQRRKRTERRSSRVSLARRSPARSSTDTSLGSFLIMSRAVTPYRLKP